ASVDVVFWADCATTVIPGPVQVKTRHSVVVYRYTREKSATPSPLRSPANGGLSDQHQVPVLLSQVRVGTNEVPVEVNSAPVEVQPLSWDNAAMSALPPPVRPAATGLVWLPSQPPGPPVSQATVLSNPVPSAREANSQIFVQPLP